MRRCVLTFHGIGEVTRPMTAGELDVWISREDFASVLDAVALVAHVEVTFDDANASDYDVALPELRRRGLTASFFVVAGRIDRSGYLSSDQLRTMGSAGMTIGNHGMRHVPWRNLSAVELHEELVEAREIIEQAAGCEVRSAACPLGQYDRQVVSSVRAGYQHLYTSDRGVARSGSFLQARSSLHRTEPLAELQRVLNAESAFTPGREIRKLAKRWR